MPWSAEEARKFKKGLTKNQAQKWARIANSVLSQCLKDGGKQKSCEARAIKVANSKVGNNNNSEEVNGVKKNMNVPAHALRFSEEANISLKDGDDEKPAFSMKAYSGKLIKGHYFWGDLAIDVNGIQFNGKRIPILEDHSWEKKLGVSNSLPKTENNEIFFDKVNLLSNPAATEFKQNLDDGFPFQSSISIRPLKVEELEEGVSAEINGYTMKGPGRIIRQSLFREASACVFGIDHRTSIQSLSESEEEIEVEVCSLSDSKKQKTEITKNGGNSMLDLTAIKEDHPDLVKQINAALKEKDDSITSLTSEKDDLKKQVTDLTAERDELKKTSESLSETKTEYEKRIAALEKAESLRKERDLKQKADSLVDQKLSASELPERLYKRVKNQIDHNAFVDSEDKFDETKFAEHVDAEIASWVEDLKDDETSGKILGLSSGNSSEDFSSDSDKLSDHMVSMAGVVDDKKAE